MPQLINWELMREPLNWLIVMLMLAIAAFGLHLALGGDGGGTISATGSAGQ
jgi:hypothetical protein